MNSEQEEQIAGLARLRDAGQLDEATYQAAVAGIRASYRAEAGEGGTVAQGPDSTAVGAGGASVGGNVGGSLVTGSGNTVSNTTAYYYGGAAPASATRPMSPQLVDLLEKLDRYFNESELKDLCFVIGIDYESLGGAGKRANARELVSVCERNGLLPQLILYCQKVRPHVTWPKIDQ